MTETNVERLKRVKTTIEKARDYLDENKNDGDWNYPKHDELVLSLFDNKDVDWIIEQAERAESLEMRYENTGSMFGRQNMLGRIEELEEENKRLREAYDTNAEVHEKLVKDYVQLRDENKELGRIATSIENKYRRLKAKTKKVEILVNSNRSGHAVKMDLQMMLREELK